MLDLRGITRLKNKYFILRHGESEANVACIISGDPEKGIKKYGLTPKGNSQVTTSIEDAIKNGWLDNKTIIISSDFKRASETAAIAMNLLGADEILFDHSLRERGFGKKDGKKNLPYTQIWPRNHAEEVDNQVSGVETPQEMKDRLFKLIVVLERNNENKTILLVSHGDVLQVLQAMFTGLSPRQARAIAYIGQGKIRNLKLSAGEVS